MSPIQIHSKTLAAFYDELKLIIDNLELSSRVRAIINETTRWETLQHEQRNSINEFLKIEAAPNRTVSNSLFMSSVSGFENFLRNLLSSVLREMESSNNIPEAIRNRNLQLSGVALSQLYSPPSHVKLDYQRITQKLGTCYSKEVKLNEEISFFIKSILELDNVLAFLKDCGIKIDWDDFSSSEDIKEFLGTTNPRETGKALKKQVKEYVESRNRIAHTGLNSSDLALNEVYGAINFFLFIAQFLTSQSETQLKSNGKT
ncbi:HEPN domain-containing protein [Cyclobacterium qasimii]|uniref:RiboL-PSP-HEPN domain-containing protein n=1 Tax=Cyclobacterium qasimii TaxID=1350429 RepID=A0A512CIY5_9BACT|nr:HEPN domain-containing protein [Cyclobacterium qasimii]GEO24189.1 hypothetical protein CQA01_47230 [Cyclobacterium qasimii]